jgi:hypothetical protein
LGVNSVPSIAQVLLTTAGAFLAAHGSYSLFTGKTAPQQQPYFAQNALHKGVWSLLP